MAITKKIYILLSVVFCLVMLSECSGDGTGITIQLSPTSPTLFSVGVTLTEGASGTSGPPIPTPSPQVSGTGSTYTVTPNWFLVYALIKNLNTVPISIVELIVTINGTVSGVLTPTVLTLSASDVTTTQSPYIVQDLSAGASATVAFYIQSIPTNYDSTALGVSMNFIGFYGPSTDPSSRLSKIVYLTTQ